VFAQVTVYVDSVPLSTPDSAAIYIAGDFNGWNPGDSNFRLAKDSTGVYNITLKAQPLWAALSEGLFRIMRPWMIRRSLAWPEFFRPPFGFPTACGCLQDNFRQ